MTKHLHLNDDDMVLFVILATLAWTGAFALGHWLGRKVGKKVLEKKENNIPTEAE